ncbi:unnamed protein product [Candidula unifasciata]|uniref:Centrosomal protein POC5 n=1 Tax=Candidula unifasciata TaxID=100452 RepID=A0A8S3Z2Y7_9EUPU|nr:unnamed protein product [Candidula unifasciata]
MSTSGKVPDVAAEVRIASPTAEAESPSTSLSARLQEEYSELLRYAVGGSGQGFQPIRSGGSSARQTPVDQQQDLDVQMKAQGNGGSGNTNTNSLYVNQPPRYRSAASTKLADANINNDVQLNTMMSSAYATIFEPPLACMSGKLDSWLGKLKRDILAEFKLLAVQILESQKNAHQEEIKEISCERQQLEKEVNRLNEMVNTCEQSMSRKDVVIENLTQALGKQRDKVSMAQAFYLTRAEHAEAKRERFTECLAAQHNRRRLTQKVMRAWFALIQKNWKNRIQKMCDKQAQDVCRQLSIDYEDKIKALNDEIENMNRKLKIMQNEKEQYAMQVKKAFMRGVCALNMETMSAFSHEDTQISPTSVCRISLAHRSVQSVTSCRLSLIHRSVQSVISCRLSLIHRSVQSVTSCRLSLIHRSVCRISLAHRSVQSVTSCRLSLIHRSIQSSISKPQKGKTRPSTAPSASSFQVKAWGTSQPLAPPMASVVVERHDPVTKQTVGKATASRYPKHSTCKGSSSHTKQKHVSKSLPGSQMFHTFQPLAGQTSSLMTPPGIKVVE